MKIIGLETLHADAGFRNFDFLKIDTDEGIVGWSEYNESFGGMGVSAAIDHLAPVVIGKDPRAFEALVQLMCASGVRLRAASCDRRSAPSRTPCSTSRPGRWAFRCTQGA